MIYFANSGNTSGAQRNIHKCFTRRWFDCEFAKESAIKIWWRDVGRADRRHKKFVAGIYIEMHKGSTTPVTRIRTIVRWADGEEGERGGRFPFCILNPRMHSGASVATLISELHRDASGLTFAEVGPRIFVAEDLETRGGLKVGTPRVGESRVLDRRRLLGFLMEMRPPPACCTLRRGTCRRI